MRDLAAVVQWQSVVRLVVAEAERRGWNQNLHAAEMDGLYVSAQRMSHRDRLARLAQLGERTDDLHLRDLSQ